MKWYSSHDMVAAIEKLLRKSDTILPCPLLSICVILCIS